MRALATDLPGVKIPTSCEACGKCELWPANHEAWSLYNQHPSLIANGWAGWQLDSMAAFEIIDRMYINDSLLMIRRLEAITIGFASAKQ